MSLSSLLSNPLTASVNTSVTVAVSPIFFVFLVLFSLVLVFPAFHVLAFFLLLLFFPMLTAFLLLLDLKSRFQHCYSWRQQQR